MDDASLDDFLSGDDAGSTEDSQAENDADSEEGQTEDETDREGEGGGLRVDPASVEPATVTSRWDGDGVVCEGCRETVQRCWESPDGFVCRTCKDWL